MTIDMKANQGLASTTISDAVFGSTFTQDVARQSVPCGSAVDIGASEYCDGAGNVSWPGPRSADDCSDGGSSSTGGTSSVSTGGSATIGTGGKKATTGGSSTVSTGGKATAGGSSAVDIGGTVVSNTGGANVTNTGGAGPINIGGAAPTNMGGASVVANAGGQSSATVGGGSAIVGVGGANAGATTVNNTTPGTAVDQGGCSCRVAGTNRNGLSAALASIGLAFMALGRRRRQSRRG